MPPSARAHADGCGARDASLREGVCAATAAPRRTVAGSPKNYTRTSFSNDASRRRRPRASVSEGASGTSFDGSRRRCRSLETPRPHPTPRTMNPSGPTRLDRHSLDFGCSPCAAHVPPTLPCAILSYVYTMCPASAEFCPKLPDVPPSLADVGQAEIDLISPDVDQIRPRLEQRYSTVSRFGAHLAQAWPMFGQVWPDLARLGASLARHQVSPTLVRRCRTTWPIWLNWGNIGATLGKCWPTSVDLVQFGPTLASTKHNRAKFWPTFATGTRVASERCMGGKCGALDLRGSFVECRSRASERCARIRKRGSPTIWSESAPPSS